MREDPQSGFFNDTYPNMYTQAFPDEITLAKEPPQAPVHLWCLPVNIPPVEQPRIAAWSLHPPLSVTLTHVNVMRSSPVTALAVTQRFRDKFVTVVIYKPRSSAASSDTSGRGAAIDDAVCRPTQDAKFKAPLAPPRAAQPQASGCKRPSISWSDLSAEQCGAETSCAAPAQQSQCVPADGALDASGGQPMDVSSRPASQHASQAAMMDLG